MLRSRLEKSLKDALLNRNDRAVSTLRLILAALKDRDIAERGKGNSSGLDDSQIEVLLQSMIKQRRESIKAYEQAGRDELAAQEAEEIAIIETFLPKQLNEQEILEAVQVAIAETGATKIKDMGKVMASLKANFSGRMDFARAGAAVKQRLG